MGDGRTRPSSLRGASRGEHARAPPCIRGRRGREAVIEASTDGGDSWMDLEDDILEGGYTGSSTAVRRSRAVAPGPGGSSGLRRGCSCRSTASPARVLLRLRAASPGEELRGGWVVDDFGYRRRSARAAASRSPCLPCAAAGRHPCSSPMRTSRDPDRRPRFSRAPVLRRRPISSSSRRRGASSGVLHALRRAGGRAPRGGARGHARGPLRGCQGRGRSSGGVSGRRAGRLYCLIGNLRVRPAGFGPSSSPGTPTSPRGAGSFTGSRAASWARERRDPVSTCP